MKLTIFFVLVVTSVSSLPPKHVYVSTTMTWLTAQANCRRLYTDLSPIVSEKEETNFKQSRGEYTRGWIGLYKDSSQWKWSGAGYANYTNLAPQLYLFSNYVFWTTDGWYAAGGNVYYGSFCFNLVVIEEKLSWEDALMYCREKHTELTNLLSEIELLLALKEMIPDQITERAWISLRYLGDQWMWVSGDPLDFTAWSQEGGMEVQCPVRGRCGALNKRGVWEDWDCQEKLDFICY